MLEWWYHTAITANNLAVFYEEYGINVSNTQKSLYRDVNIDTVKHYYRISYHRRPNIKAACSLAGLAFEEKEYMQALFYYKRALRIKKRPELFYNLAIQYSFLKKYDCAITCLNKALLGLKPTYQREATRLLIYVCCMGGYKNLARDHFRHYVKSCGEPDLDLLHLAYICQEYDYIDRYCMTLSGERDLEVIDVELVIHALYLVEKKKLAKYFLEKCLKNSHYVGKAEWVEQCENVIEKAERGVFLEYSPVLELEPIAHKKMY